MTEENNTHKDRVFIGIAYGIGAHFLFCVMSICAKYLSETYHVAEIAFYRNAIVLMPLFLFIMIGRQHLLKTKQPLFVSIRAIVGGFSLIVTYGALSYLPISYAAVLFFTSTIITPIFCFLFLKEHVGIHRWGAVIMGMVGVYIISQPSGEYSHIGLALALLAAFMHASMFVILRKLKTEKPLTITFYFVLAGMIIPGLSMPWLYTPIRPDHIWIFLLVAASGGIAQFLLASAYKYAPASVVTPFGYSALLWTLLADIFIWQYDLDYFAITIGAGLIIIAQLYILHREYLNKKKSQNHE